MEMPQVKLSGLMGKGTGENWRRLLSHFFSCERCANPVERKGLDDDLLMKAQDQELANTLEYHHQQGIQLTRERLYPLWLLLTMKVACLFKTFRWQLSLWPRRQYSPQLRLSIWEIPLFNCVSFIVFHNKCTNLNFIFKASVVAHTYISSTEEALTVGSL